jgi:hypothetical protein
MRGCLRPSRQIATGTAALLAVAAYGCGPRTLIVVDPDPCLDGGAAPGCPIPPVQCTDGGIQITGIPGCVPFALIDGLVGYWPLNDGAGSTIAIDLTEKNPGTLVELNPATAWTMGKAAGGLNVAGAGFVNVPSSVSIDSIVDQVTIAGWGYLSATGTIDDYATIASREEGTTIDQHYHISINSRGEGPAMWLKTETVTMLLEGPTPVARQTWVHIAGTYDGTMARLYLNGQQVDSKPITGRFLADTTPFILGANGNGNASAGPNVSERFPGRIDEVMLYRRALSAAEIGQIYAGALFASPLPGQDAGARD